MNKHLHHIILMCCLFVSNGICVAQTDTANELVLKFKPRVISLSAAQKQQLESFKKMHCNDTTLSVRIIFPLMGRVCGKRAENVILFLTDTTKNCLVQRNKIHFFFPGEMNRDEVHVRWDNGEDEGPNMVPAPHPKYIKQ